MFPRKPFDLLEGLEAFRFFFKQQKRGRCREFSASKEFPDNVHHHSAYCFTLEKTDVPVSVKTCPTGMFLRREPRPSPPCAKCCCLKKNPATPRPSEHPPVMGEKMSVVVVVSHIQRNGCQPEKNYFNYTVANPARGLLNRYKQAFLPYRIF